MSGRKSDPTDGLSDGQIQCLERVARGMSSKEIARDLGFSPHTVDTYVKRAMAKLGVSNRREAARRVIGVPEYQNSGSPAPDLVSESGTSMFDAEPPASAVARGLPPIGGSRNGLDRARRHWAMLMVAGAGLAVVLALFLVIAGAFWVFAEA